MVGLNGLAGLSLGLQVPLAELLRAAGIRANLGLPSFAGYLDAVLPELSEVKRRKLERAFEVTTGQGAEAVPAIGSGAGDLAPDGHASGGASSTKSSTGAPS